MFSMNWHQPIVSHADGWHVSDNGENVVAFGPSESLDFGHGADREAIAARITELGNDEFTRRARTYEAASGGRSVYPWELAFFADDALCHRIWYTADVISPDDTDTDTYGEPTEPGHGQTCEGGFVSPDWSKVELHDKREEVEPDVYDAGDERSPEQWLADQISERLGVTEDNGDGTWYAADFHTHSYQTGVQYRLAAHAEGFTEYELEEASELIKD